MHFFPQVFLRLQKQINFQNSFGIYLFTVNLRGFLSTLCLSPWLGKSSKCVMLRLPENAFVCQEIESKHFYSCPQNSFSAEYYDDPRAKRNYSPSPKYHFLKTCSLQQKIRVEETIVLEKSQFIFCFYGCLATHKKPNSYFISFLRY